MSALPLVHAPDLDAPIAWADGRFVSRGEYLAHVTAAAASLPDGRHAINLCVDRYRFMVAFGALLLRSQINLLPPNHAPEVIDEIASEYDAYCLTDQAADDITGIATPIVRLDFAKAEVASASMPPIPSARTAAILFTSGSTGKSQATPKSWGQLVRSTELALRRFGLDEEPAHIVATVPAQHSYGLESTALYALLSASTVGAGRPFYAEDVRSALDAQPEPRVLVTTPIHLRACTEAGLEWPHTAYIISATAPLSDDLALAAERAFGCPVYEIYGCSEAGAIASRRTLDGPLWHLYDGMSLEPDGERIRVNGPQLTGAQTLSDALRVHPEERFELLGRTSDMLNIAGKRGSLEDLNHRLLNLEGVEDGVFVPLGEGNNDRLAALVVAPGIDKTQILGQLRRVLDPVFLPRPLIKVDALPRNATGKLPRQTLLDLLARHRAGTVRKTEPLMHAPDLEAPLLWHEGHPVSRGEFLGQVSILARTLPDRPRALNLNDDRYRFMLGFAALLLRKQTNLLPPSHAPQVLEEIATQYGAYCLTDHDLEARCPQQQRVEISPEAPAGDDAVAPPIPAGQEAAVLFTSGSTGKAQPRSKQWGRLVAGIRTGMRRFGLDTNPHRLVATVPPQHMFGLEFTILYPLLGPCSVHSGRPFYPEDIRAALAGMPGPRVLLTTPVHLQACVEAGLQWPETAFVICSTAQLETELAALAETTFGCPVHEIYGSSETGAVASRRTAHERLWSPLDGIAVDIVDGGLLRVSGRQLEAPQILDDYAELHADGRFELQGRRSELVNIAGKRISLGELNHRLLAIEGVEDGVFLLPEDSGRSRLTALVVAPRLSEAQVLRALARAIDPVFLPRPLFKVDALPRNSIGKLPRQALLELAARG